jgi:uncharacterized protein YbjT (DUF2867 family)
MATVLVTGGTGTLGSHLVPQLRAAGHDVRVLSRRSGDGRLVGDLTTGAGLVDAVAGVDVIVHAATNPARPKRVEVGGTQRLLAAATAARVPHLLYVSIVGVDRHPLPYYKAKWATEQLVEAGGVPWTIFRATQFHELLDRVFTMMWGPRIAPRGFRFQVLAASEAAARIVALVAGGAAGRAPDMGGPAVRDIDDLARTWLAARGRRRPILRVPAPGAIGRAFREGVHLAPDHADGTITWEQWLER